MSCSSEQLLETAGFVVNWDIFRARARFDRPHDFKPISVELYRDAPGGVCIDQLCWAPDVEFSHF